VADTNVRLVEALVTAVRSVGRDVAGIADARRIFNLGV
jgi:hypothetical protein